MSSQLAFRVLRVAAIGGALLSHSPRVAEAQQHDTSSMSMPMGDRTHGMKMIEPLGISMNRMGSGTSWIPDAVTLPSRERMAGSWDLMLHGFVFAQYDKQDGRRRDEQLGSLNWGMFMASHELAAGRVQARTMLSFDPWTVTPRGYPLLLQSGESYRGSPLHDRQHPHDFFMELGVLYDRALSQNVGVELYAAPSGEPALGPVAFMHRPSAMDNPTAPIGHHWQDATHIAFGVVTAGVYTRGWKLEGSAFNGREPDENRWDFDPIRLDSYSGRVTFNPTEHWSLAAGYGYLKSPEALHPAESVHRVTASMLHGTTIGSDGQWSTALVWGANRFSSTSGWSSAALVESEAILDRWNTVYGRAELARKSAEDLALPFAPDRIFPVGNASLGYIRELGRGRGVTFGVGAQAIVNLVPSSLETAYGSRTPLGGLVFVRFRSFHVRPAMTGMKPMDDGAAVTPVGACSLVLESRPAAWAPHRA